MISQRIYASLVSGLMLAGMLSLAPKAHSQTNYFGTNGTEYAVIGSLAGDQIYPDVAVNTAGGLVVCFFIFGYYPSTPKESKRQ